MTVSFEAFSEDIEFEWRGDGRRQERVRAEKDIASLVRQTN